MKIEIRMTINMYKERALFQLVLSCTHNQSITKSDSKCFYSFSVLASYVVNFVDLIMFPYFLITLNVSRATQESSATMISCYQKVTISPGHWYYLAYNQSINHKTCKKLKKSALSLFGHFSLSTLSLYYLSLEHS